MKVNSLYPPETPRGQGGHVYIHGNACPSSNDFPKEQAPDFGFAPHPVAVTNEAIILVVTGNLGGGGGRCKSYHVYPGISRVTWP